MDWMKTVSFVLAIIAIVSSILSLVLEKQLGSN